MELQDNKYIYGLKQWFSRNWEFAGVGLLVAIYIFLANFFIWGPSFTNGTANFSGGSDPYFNWYVITFTITHHISLLNTSGLNYPLSSGDPRPLFFHWMIVFLAEITGPIFGGTIQAAYYSFMEFDAVFGALLIIPVFLLGKSIIGKKGGMIAAVLYTLMPSNLTSGILSDGRMHTPELIFAFFAIYFFERAVKYANKGRVIEGGIFDFRGYSNSIRSYFSRNKKATFYALFSGASYGALMLSWQGHAYILAIISIYVVLQFIVNMFLGRNTGYLLVTTIIFVALSFAMGGYYYYGAHNLPSAWYVAPLLIGIGVIFLGILIGLVGRKPWIISVPMIVILVSMVIGGLSVVDHRVFIDIISGDGYFIKSKLYSTIAEAQAPALGQYIDGFGVAQFILGIGGILLISYKFLKERKESFFFLLIFSGVSIYMSLAAARFNITASPAYAILGGALVYYFADIIKISSIKDDTKTKKSFRKRAGIKGNLGWLQAIFVLIVVFGILIPSGLGVISTAVPINSAPTVNHQVYNALPSFAKPANYQVNTSAYFGTTGSQVVNASSPLSQSLAWLATQQANQSLSNKPAYVNWWDYGFQELCQGKHPTVADDFQQAYQVAGQILLSTNESQIIGLFTARLMDGVFVKNSGQYSTSVKLALSQYFGSGELKILKKIYANPLQYKNWIADNSTVYGSFTTSISSTNAYYALIKGQLASKLSLNNLVNLYQSLQEATGYSIQYIQIDHGLFPLSGLNTGTFYAPAFLTDTPTYTSAAGAVVPYKYYQIFVQTTNGTFPLNQTPANAVPTGYQLGYTPAFYNTTIYKAMVGLPPSAVGQTNGIPGLDYGTNKYTMEPAYNMSNFEICYEGIPYNPYSNFSAHPGSFKILPLKEAYTLNKAGKGKALIFPQLATIIQSSDPILRYFPGAVITGQVKTPNGLPVSGVRVTIFDQYQIPHQTVFTNKNGFYNITALPGNDTVVYTYGNLNKQYLIGNNYLSGYSVTITNQQAERSVTGVNTTSGLPNYYLVKNLNIANTSLYGSVTISGHASTLLKSGTLNFINETTKVSYKTSISNGNYTIKNIPIGAYRINVATVSQTYKNVSRVVISNATNKQNNIQIKLNQLTVAVSSYGRSVSGTTVLINNAKVQTNKSGQATIYLNAGNYSVKTVSNKLTSSISKVSFNQLNLSSTVNLNLNSGDNINITVSGVVINGNLTLYQNGNLANSYNLTSTGLNRFSGILPSGYYLIYDHSGSMGLYTYVNLNSSMNLSLSAKSIVPETVIVSNAKISSYSGILGAVEGKSAVYINRTSLQNLTLYLPVKTNYSFFAEVSKSGNNYYASKEINVFAFGNVYLSLSTAQVIDVGFYNPAISSSLTAKSEVPSGVSFFNFVSNQFEVSPIQNGFAAVYAPGTSTNGLSVFAYSEGFITSSSTVFSGERLPMIVKEHKISIYFKSKSFSSSLNGNMELFGISDYSSSVVNGVANLSVSDGSYVIALSGTNMMASNYTSTLSIESNTISSTVYFEPLISLTFLNAKNVAIYYTNGTSVGASSNLPTGNYTIYASQNSLASIYSIDATHNTTSTPVYSNSYSLGISNSLNGKYLFYLTTNGFTITTTQRNLLLPTGTYNLLLRDQISNSTSEYLLTSNTNISVVSDQSIYLKITNQTFLTSVNGKLTNNYGEPNGAYTIEAFRNGRLVNSTVSNSLGGFTLRVPNGNYTFYAYSSQYMMAQTGTFRVGVFQNSLPYNPTLSPGHKIYISTTLQSNAKSLSVNVTRNQEMFKVMSNGAPLILPTGNYTFSAFVSSSVTQNNFNTYYAFRSSVTTETSAEKTVLMNLEKVLIGNLTIQQSPMKSISEFQKVTYTINITNLLNSEENFTLKSGTAKWQEKFTQSSFSNVGINKTVSTNITLNNTVLVKSGVNKVPILVTYNGGSQLLNVKVNINKVYNFTGSYRYNVPTYVNNTATFYLKLKNTGNTNETINLNITNISNLSFGGWTAKIQYNGKNVSSLGLNFSQSKIVTVVMTPIKVGASKGSLLVSIKTTLANKPSVSKYDNFTFLPQSAPSITGSSSGIGVISHFTENPFLPIEIGLIVIAISVVAGFATIAIRGRRKK